MSSSLLHVPQGSLPGGPFFVHVITAEAIDDQTRQSTENDIGDEPRIVIGSTSGKVPASNLLVDCVRFDMFIEIQGDLFPIAVPGECTVGSGLRNRNTSSSWTSICFRTRSAASKRPPC